MTLVSSLTIGIPGFFFAFIPDTPVAKPSFILRVVVFAMPAHFLSALVLRLTGM